MSNTRLSSTFKQYRIEIIVTIALVLFGLIVGLLVEPNLSRSEAILAEIIIGGVVIMISLGLMNSRKVDLAMEEIALRLAGEAKLMEFGDSWVVGAQLIEQLDRGELLACASNPWPPEAKRYYIANQRATEKGIKITRIFGSTQGSQEFARKQLSEGACTEARLYTGDNPLINYIIAVSDGTPRWAMIWIAGYPTMLYAVLFYERSMLTQVLEDFKGKMRDSNELKKD